MKISDQIFQNRLFIGDGDGGSLSFENCEFHDGVEVKHIDGVQFVNCTARVRNNAVQEQSAAPLYVGETPKASS